MARDRTPRRASEPEYQNAQRLQRAEGKKVNARLFSEHLPYLVYNFILHGNYSDTSSSSFKTKVMIILTRYSET